MTSGAKAEGRFGKQDFVYQPAADVYRCPAGETLKYHYTQRRERSDATSLLDHRLPELPDQAPVHASQRAPDHPPGSMSISSKPCSGGSTRTPRPCATGARRSNTLRHDLCRNLIRVCGSRSTEAGAFDDDAGAADLIQAYGSPDRRA